MNTVAKVTAASVIAACAHGLCAAEITWGGSSGRWHTKSNWIGGEKPATGDSAIFPAIGSYAVEIDNKTPELSYVKVLPGSAEDVVMFTDDDSTDETFRSLFVDGDGYSFVIGENRKVKIAGNRLCLGDNGVKTYADIGPNAELSIESGKLYIESGGILVNTNATLKVSGGSIEYKDTRDYLKLAKGATVVFNGGSNVVGRIANYVKVSDKGVVISEFDGDGSKVVFAGGYTAFPDAYAMSSYLDLTKTTIELTGGILDVNFRIDDSIKMLLPAKDSELRNSYAGNSITDEGSKTDAVWWIGGKTSFTNISSQAKFAWRNNTYIKGGGLLSIGMFRIGEKECHADLARLNLFSGFQSYTDANKRGQFCFEDGITFGANGDIGVESLGNSVFVPKGKVVFDTVDALDGYTMRAFALSSCFDFSGMTSFEVKGAGTVGLASVDGLGCMHCFEVAAGASVFLTNSMPLISVSKFKLGERSILSVGTNVVDVSALAELGANSKIRYQFNSLQPGTTCPLWFGPHGSEPPVSHFEFEPDLPDGWAVATSGSTAYLWDGTYTGADDSTRGYWTGEKSGFWNEAGNWGKHNGADAIPGGNTSVNVKFTGNKQLSVTNDWPNSQCFMRNLATSASSGPYTVSGNSFWLRYPESWQYDSPSVVNWSALPFTVESKVFKYRNSSDSTHSFFNVLANTKAPLVLSGGGVLTNAVLHHFGDVRLGGEWVTLGLCPAEGRSGKNRLVLNPGAYLETTEQGSNQTSTASYQISAGAGMTINGSVWRWTTKENTHFVDGVVTSTCPVQATARQTFIGDGVLSLAMVQSDAEGVGDLKFAEDITVRPAGWKTVRAGADNPMTMVARGNATIGAWGDWAYGAEEGFESSTAAADRALKVVGGAKTYVSFDTEGNTITLKDPLVVEKWSTVIKKGDGALALKSDENDLADSEIELRGGELRLSEPQAFGKLTFAGGKIAIDDGFNADTYTPIFTAKKIIGEVEVAGRFGVKTVAGDNGITVSVRRKRGAAVILR